MTPVCSQNAQTPLALDLGRSGYGGEPRPGDIDSPAGLRRKLVEHASADVQIRRFATDAAVYDSDVHASFCSNLGVVPLGPDLQAAEGVLVGIRAFLHRVEERVTDGNDVVAVLGGDAARSESDTVVSEITSVSFSVVGKRQVLAGTAAQCVSHW